MDVRPVSLNLDQNTTLVRALRSLSISDAEIVAKKVNAVGGNWSIQTVDDYEGYLFMLIEPAPESAGRLSSYIVSGKCGQSELAIIDGDLCQTLSRFSNIDSLAAELASRLLGADTQQPQQRL